MPQPEKAQIYIADFQGLELGSDGQDLQPGTAQDQVNIQSDQRGAMRVRLGARLVTFEEE